MTISTKFISGFAIAGITLLAACGGASTSPSYEVLNEPNQGTRAVSGVAVNVPMVGDATYASSTGTVDADTLAATLTVGNLSATGTLVADPTNAGEFSMTDGDVTANVYTESGYDYLVFVDLENSATGDEALSIIGIQTEAGFMPASGSVTYNGILGAFGELQGQEFELDGDATITANFGSGNVTMLGNNLVIVDSNTGNPITASFDEIVIDGISISGNTFSGGTTVFSSGGTDVASPFGNNQTTAITGSFFGWDTGVSAPDEVGGFVSVGGDDGYANGTVIAD